MQRAMVFLSRLAVGRRVPSLRGGGEDGRDRWGEERRRAIEARRSGGRW